MRSAIKIEREIRKFLSDRGVGNGLTAQTDLISSGILDSLLIMDLIAHLEHAYCVNLENDDVSPAHFRTTAALAELVDSRQTGVAVA